MSVTTILLDKIAQIKTYLVFIAFLFFEYPLVFALNVIGYEKGKATKILKAVIAKLVNLAIVCNLRFQLVLFKNKILMENEIKKTMNSIRDAFLNLVRFGLEFPNSLILILLCFKFELIIMSLILDGICTYVINSCFLALRRVSCFVRT